MTHTDDPLPRRVIGCAMEVHRHLGPGLLESIYEDCLVFELREQGIQCDRQFPVPVLYKGRQISCDLRCDLVVERKLVIELKTVETLLPIHEAQLMTYMRLLNMSRGLLLNFKVRLLKDGIIRRVL